MLLNKEESETLLCASLATASFNLPKEFQSYLEIYMQSIYKGFKLPLAGFCFDLLGVIFEWQPAFKQNNSFSQIKQRFNDHILADFKYSKECLEIKLLLSPIKDLNRQLIFAKRFLEVFFEDIETAIYQPFDSAILRDILKSELDLETALDLVLDNANYLKHFDIDSLIIAYQQKKPLISEEDLWELASLNDLPNDALRYAAKSCKRHLDYLNRHNSELKRKISYQLNSLFIEKSQDLGNYPVGGIAGVTNNGRFENLLASELVFLDEVVYEELDFFDIRYLENELLYYERDEQSVTNDQVEVILYLLPQSPWPGFLVKDQSQPFLLFAMLYWCLNELILQSPGLNICFTLNFYYKDKSFFDYSPLARAFFNKLIEKSILKIEVINQLPKDFTNKKVIFIGKYYKNQLSLVASGDTYSIYPLNQSAKSFALEKGFLDFIVNIVKEFYCLIH